MIVPQPGEQHFLYFSKILLKFDEIIFNRLNKRRKIVPKKDLSGVRLKTDRSKIDFFVSTSYVDFLKAHIKLS